MCWYLIRPYFSGGCRTIVSAEYFHFYYLGLKGEGKNQNHRCFHCKRDEVNILYLQKEEASKLKDNFCSRNSSCVLKCLQSPLSCLSWSFYHLNLYHEITSSNLICISLQIYLLKVIYSLSVLSDKFMVIDWRRFKGVLLLCLYFTEGCIKMWVDCLY